ncbi:MAG: hypothetical protein JWR54_1563 [Mucilaginibacter sp.]|nr:hypothetical protein [Mucilaginibacter sp.]
MIILIIKEMKKLLLITTILAISLTSCLKDNSHYVDFANAGNIVNMPLSGLSNFSKDALTADHDTVQFAVSYATANANKALTVTIGVDTTYIAKYEATNSAIQYLAMPSSVYKISTTTVSIAAGAQYTFVTLIVDKTLVDPAKSYMLPIVIKDAQGVPISSNMNVHYYHVIGNDFAGAYTYDYRRWQNGVGPGAGIIPSQSSAGVAVDITSLGQNTTIYPVTPTEFQMVTNYNGQGVNYDVTFTRTVTGSTINYTNWKVTFLTGDIAKWTSAGITNFVPPAFTIPPPATNSDPKKFELNFASGGAAPGRYIDDTYTKQ